MFRTICVLALVTLALAHQSYISEIPNGAILPDPCGSGTKAGSGHINLDGGGNRNPFGLAFANEGYKWTVALCQADSDNDGKSNGAEVGDPSCQWTKENPTALSQPEGQPGVCEPLNSQKCAGQTFSCPSA